jgi:hypothetical protein
VAARADLALAYFHLAWYDEAIRLNVEILEELRAWCSSGMGSLAGPWTR